MLKLRTNIPRQSTFLFIPRNIYIYIIYSELSFLDDVFGETLSNQSKKKAYSKTFQVFDSSSMWYILLFYIGS